MIIRYDRKDEIRIPQTQHEAPTDGYPDILREIRAEQKRADFLLRI